MGCKNDHGCRFLDDSLIPNDPDVLSSAYSSEPSSVIKDTDSPVVIPWLLPGEIEMKPSHYANQAMDPNVNDGGLPIILRNLDPMILQYLSQNEVYANYIMKEDGVTVDPERLEQVQERIRQEMMTNAIPAYSASLSTGNHVGMAPLQDYSASYSAPHPSGTGQYHWQPLTNEQQNYHYAQSNNGGNAMMPSQARPVAMPQPLGQPMMPAHQDFTFSVPSLSQISVSSGYGANAQYVPPIQPPSQRDGKKGIKTVACRLFNTPEGCRFGDKCSFIHNVANTSTASVRPVVKGPNKPGQRMGPGVRR